MYVWDPLCSAPVVTLWRAPLSCEAHQGPTWGWNRGIERSFPPPTCVLWPGSNPYPNHLIKDWLFFTVQNECKSINNLVYLDGSQTRNRWLSWMDHKLGPTKCFGTVLGRSFSLHTTHIYIERVGWVKFYCPYSPRSSLIGCWLLDPLRCSF